MANLDPLVATTIDHANASGQDVDEDTLIDQLEKDDDDDHVSHLREQRLQQLHTEFARVKHMRNNEGHGRYEEIKEEKKLMDITTSTKLCTVHFWKPDFNRCRVLDGHFETLAPLHLDTRFVRIDVTNAPFLVTKLKVQVLPCVLCFIDGVSTDRIIGFEGIGRGTDRFETSDLEIRLWQAGVLPRLALAQDPTLNTRKEARETVTEDDDDDEWN